MWACAEARWKAQRRWELGAAARSGHDGHGRDEIPRWNDRGLRRVAEARPRAAAAPVGAADRRDRPEEAVDTEERGGIGGSGGSAGGSGDPGIDRRPAVIRRIDEAAVDTEDRPSLQWAEARHRNAESRAQAWRRRFGRRRNGSWQWLEDGPVAIPVISTSWYDGYGVSA